MYFIEYARTYVFLHDFTNEIYQKLLVGSPAVLIRDEIHCNEYPRTRRVMSVGYPGRKFSTRFNPNIDIDIDKRLTEQLECENTTLKGEHKRLREQLEHAKTALIEEHKRLARVEMNILVLGLG